jgi:hypothetical protein
MVDEKITARVALRVGMIGLALCVVAGRASAADSLCAPDETVFFNCRIKDSPKLLSVCGRAGEDARRGAALPGDYLQYRFGSHDKPELFFPKTRAGSLDRFRVAHEYVRSAFYESHQLSFRSGGADYRVYAVSQLADQEPAAPPDEYGGVVVGVAGGHDINVPCGTVPENDLGSLVRNFGVEHREDQAEADDVAKASFQLCQAMSANGVTIDNELRPLNDAFMMGLHESPDIIDLKEGAVEQLVAKPLHGKLAPERKTPGRQAAWRYTPAPGFAGNDRAEFVVRGTAKTGEAVEFRLIYQLRMEADHLSAYFPRRGLSGQPVRDMYCLIPYFLLDYVPAR